MKRPLKKLEDFELFPPNLLHGVPFEYGFVYRENNRAIQKADAAALRKSMIENYMSISYVKEGPDCDFMPFGTEKWHQEIIVEGIKAAEKDEIKKKKYTLIAIGGFLVFFSLIGFFSDLDVEASVPLFFNLLIAFIATAGFFVRKRFVADDTEPTKKMHKIIQRESFTKNSIKPVAFFLPVIFLLCYLIQTAGNYDFSNWIVDCSVQHEMCVLPLLTASFFHSNWLFLVLSVCLSYFLTALLLERMKFTFIILTFIVASMAANLTYYYLGTDVMYGAISGIIGLWAAFLGSFARENKRETIFQLSYWIVITIVCVLLFNYSANLNDWHEFTQYIISFWSGIIIGLILAKNKTAKI